MVSAPLNFCRPYAYVDKSASDKPHISGFVSYYFYCAFFYSFRRLWTNESVIGVH